MNLSNMSDKFLPSRENFLAILTLKCNFLAGIISLTVTFVRDNFFHNFTNSRAQVHVEKCVSVCKVLQLPSGPNLDFPIINKVHQVLARILDVPHYQLTNWSLFQ